MEHQQQPIKAPVTGGGGEWVGMARFVAAVAVSAAVAGGLTWWWVTRGDPSDEEIDPEGELPSMEEVWAKCPEELVRKYKPQLARLAFTSHHALTESLRCVHNNVLQGSDERRNELKEAGLWPALLHLFLSLAPTETEKRLPQLGQICFMLFSSAQMYDDDEEIVGLALAMRHAQSLAAQCPDMTAQRACVRLLKQLLSLPQALVLARDSDMGTVSAFARALTVEPLPAVEPATDMQETALVGIVRAFGNQDPEGWAEEAVAALVQQKGFVERLMQIFERSTRSHDGDFVKQIETPVQLPMTILWVGTIYLSYYCNADQYSLITSKVVSNWLITGLLRYQHAADRTAWSVRYNLVRMCAKLLSVRDEAPLAAGRGEYLVQAGRFQRQLLKPVNDSDLSAFGSLISMTVNHDHNATVASQSDQDEFCCYLFSAVLSICQDNRDAREEARANESFMEAVRVLAQPSFPPTPYSAPRAHCADTLLTVFQLP